ncbi:uncharacterized protein LOC5503952 isoform X2 [Nematostella vectensis]|uniref:uncharacterized protein LOC5503952 isoform X2 n=1 Tax=Nematostella vectensis TaxID=45351 RepID=UPI00138FBF59|nr:uncharacterized protein LOC5503952 isoform X2 [Nematostella vectensis]
MNKISALLFLGCVVAITWAFPREETSIEDAEELESKSSYLSKREKLEEITGFAKMKKPYSSRREKLEEMRAFDRKRQTKEQVICEGPAKLALESYHIDLSKSHLCGENSKRWANDFKSFLRKRELEYHMSSNYRRNMNACCSPDCDWLLQYLEVDSQVIKCVDKK